MQTRKILRQNKDYKLDCYACNNRRVARIYKDSSFLATGVSDDIWNAIDIAGRNFDSDNPHPSIPDYAIFDATSYNELDTLIMSGHRMECFYDRFGKQFVSKIWTRKHQNVPEQITQQVRRVGLPVQWSERGFVFEAFPNQARLSHVSCRLISSSRIVDAEESGVWHYNTHRIGEAPSFWDSIHMAVRAAEYEVPNVD